MFVSFPVNLALGAGSSTDTSPVTKAGATGTTAGSNQWINPGFCNNTGQSATLSSGANTTGQLLITNFGFNIPTGATIDGIKVTWSLKDDSGNVGFGFCTPNLSGSQKGDPDSGASAGINTGSFADCSFGNPTDLWNTTWSVANINDSTFGANLNNLTYADNDTCYATYCKITVWFH